MSAQPYPLWKKVVWRFVRVFIATLLVELAAHLDAIGGLGDVYPLLILPAVSAAVVALAKAIREWVASEDYTNLLHKLPV